MADELRLLGVFAHPDDETLGFGGILAKYAAEGVATHVVTATRGERGWFGDPDDYPGPAALGRIREAELRAAAAVLGVQRVDLLGYLDGELDRADPTEVVTRLVGHLRRVRPHVVVTFGPDGAYGHPDHIAISQLTAAAVVAAADGSYADAEQLQSHRVAKLYYRIQNADELATYESVFGDLVMKVDGVERRGVSWPEWLATTRIDTTAHWRTIWRAVRCHRSQLPGYDALLRLPEDLLARLWDHQLLYRVYSLVNSGREPENDLLAGLR